MGGGEGRGLIKMSLLPLEQNSLKLLLIPGYSVPKYSTPVADQVFHKP